jgi:hypothetical protein
VIFWVQFSVQEQVQALAVGQVEYLAPLDYSFRKPAVCQFLENFSEEDEDDDDHGLIYKSPRETN